MITVRPPAKAFIYIYIYIYIKYIYGNCVSVRLRYIGFLWESETWTVRFHEIENIRTAFRVLGLISSPVRFFSFIFGFLSTKFVSFLSS